MPQIVDTRNKKLKQNLTEKNGREIESVATQELTILHRVQRKERKQDLQLVQLNTGLRKKFSKNSSLLSSGELQGHSKKFFSLYFQNEPIIIERCTNKKKMKKMKNRNLKYFHLISYKYLKIL